jgi:pilus assembly protein CpaF
MIQAMNTGHHGSITTVHANSPRDALARLETTAMMAGLELPLLAIRRQIASAINLVIHISRLTDGSRKITHITEISGMEVDVVTMSDLFKFEQTGIGADGKIQGNYEAHRPAPDVYAAPRSGGLQTAPGDFRHRRQAPPINAFFNQTKKPSFTNSAFLLHASDIGGKRWLSLSKPLFSARLFAILLSGRRLFSQPIFDLLLNLAAHFAEFCQFGFIAAFKRRRVFK